MTFIVAVLAGIAASATWAFGVRALHAISGRRGHLAGYWWMVTYPASERTRVETKDGGVTTKEVPVAAQLPSRDMIRDTEMSAWASRPGSTGIWSIELARVRHHSRSQKLTAKSWRIVTHGFDRRWLNEAVVSEDSVIDGTYRCTRGDGDHGTFSLRRASSGRYLGVFTAAETVVERDGVSYHFFSAPLEWIKVGSTNEGKLDEWLLQADLASNQKLWPLFARRIIAAKLGIPPRWPQWFAMIGYGNSLQDITYAYAVSQAERERVRRIIETQKRADTQAGEEQG